MSWEAIIREETPDDIPAVAEVHVAAFGRGAEAALVMQLRSDDAIIVSIVAIVNGNVVGNAIFSKLTIRMRDGREETAVGLAPVAVMPSFQRHGLGRRIIEAGLSLCAKHGYRSAFVLGDPTYYRRFGFSVGATTTLESRYKGSHWMAKELVSGALDGLIGAVEYPRAFVVVD